MGRVTPAQITRGFVEAREGAEALELELERPERLDGRGDGQAQLVQVAVPDVAQERQGDVKRQGATSTGIPGPRG